MSKGSTKTSFMGISSELPIYVSPVAMAKLGHPVGEVNITRAAGDCSIVQTVSANASCSLEEIVEAKKESQALFYQMYIDENRNKSAEILKKVELLGFKAIVFTVDCGWWSKRTLEERIDGTIPKSVLGTFMATGGLQDRTISWDDISWMRRYTKLPIIVKGVCTLEDVELCVKHGADGVMISNHGGRQVDYAPAPIDILYEIRTYRPDLFTKIEVMIDGGVRSGADVVKLLALGAKAVGLGRTFLYANATHGEEGARRVIEILRTEITNTMRNIGAATISDLKPEMKCTSLRPLMDEIEDVPDPQYPAIVLKYVNATLLDASVTQKLNSVELKYVLERLLQAIDILHREEIVHTDIKSDNVLVNYKRDNCSNNDDTNRFSNVLLGDLGGACPTHDPIAKSGTPVGAPIWTSPEVLMESQWNKATDIWSFGTLAISLIYGGNFNIFRHKVVPFGHEEYNLEILKEQFRFFGPFPPKIDDITSEDTTQIIIYLMDEIPQSETTPFCMITENEVCKEDKVFIGKIMMMDWRDRPSAQDLLDDKWFEED
ncbi:hypothetical protein MBLNU459_g4850t2 [Dothideomycetes sp. NU459]